MKREPVLLSVVSIPSIVDATKGTESAKEEAPCHPHSYKLHRAVASASYLQPSQAEE